MWLTLHACLVGVLECLFAFCIAPLRKVIPRAALLSSLAGVSITFISMGFAFEIWAHPVTAIAPLVMILSAYGSGVLLPLNCPGALAAMVFGIVIAWACYGLSFVAGLSTLGTIYSPGGNSTMYTLDYPYFPPPCPQRLINVLSNGQGTTRNSDSKDPV